MPLQLVQHDITRMATDAIVNAANSQLLPGGGVCGAIFAAAGYGPLDRACQAIGHCDTGEAVITEGFSLPARYVIHAVGPIWRGGGHNEAALLSSCYTNALRVAAEHGCESVAFPLISSGIYGYPKAEALSVAVSAIQAFLREQEMLVYLVFFDRSAVALDRGTEMALRQYFGDCCEKDALTPCTAEDWQAFLALVRQHTEQRGMSEAELCWRANLGRKRFSELCSQPASYATKGTVLALAIAWELDQQETDHLLNTAGFALLNRSIADNIVRYFIAQKQYDIVTLNNALFFFEQETLGG